MKDEIIDLDENKDVDNTFVIDLNSDNNSLSDELTNETNSGLNDTKKSKKKVPILTFKHIKNVPKNVFIIGSIVFFVVVLFMGKVFFSKNYCSVPTKKTLDNKLFVADGKNNINIDIIKTINLFIILPHNNLTIVSNSPYIIGTANISIITFPASSTLLPRDPTPASLHISDAIVVI